MPLLSTRVEIVQSLILASAVQGNCSTPPPAALLSSIEGPPLHDFKPKQCLIVVTEPLLENMGFGSGPQWLDNLYVRVGYQEKRKWDYEPDVTLLSSAQLYLTGVTIQGNGHTEVRAIDAQFSTFESNEKTSLYTSGELPPLQLFLYPQCCCAFIKGL